VFIPTIDFSAYNEQDDAVLDDLASRVSDALTHSGFMKIVNLGITQAQIDHTFELSTWFFSRSEEEKSTSAYVSAEENFGYQSLGVEHLDPSKPADLKQTFTLRDLLRHDRSDPRWPTPEFRDELTNFYTACLEGAYRIQRVFSKALGMEQDFFVQYHQGENVSLRLLYYPSSGIDDIAAGQLGAGAHTDYGMITLLFQKDIGGLEVQDAEGAWHPVAPENDAIVINTGDLMERWTNGRYRSTPHRVQPKRGDVDRYSIAVFVDPDTETPVKVLDSCLIAGQRPKFPEVTAGEHIQERIRASHGARRDASTW
jgi:isopenicillin N synthase-like dioxygenase